MGRKPFKPTDEDRNIVRIMAGCEYAHDRICLRIMHNGRPIHKNTLLRHFQIELTTGKARIDALVMSKCIELIQNGDWRAIEFYMERKMWREGHGGFRSAPSLSEHLVHNPYGSSASGEGVPSLDLHVHFAGADPSKKPVLIDSAPVQRFIPTPQDKVSSMKMEAGEAQKGGAGKENSRARGTNEAPPDSALGGPRIDAERSDAEYGPMPMPPRYPGPEKPDKPKPGPHDVRADYDLDKGDHNEGAERKGPYGWMAR